MRTRTTTSARDGKILIPAAWWKFDDSSSLSAKNLSMEKIKDNDNQGQWRLSITHRLEVLTRGSRLRSSTYTECTQELTCVHIQRIKKGRLQYVYVLGITYIATQTKLVLPSFVSNIKTRYTFRPIYLILGTRCLGTQWLAPVWLNASSLGTFILLEKRAVWAPKARGGRVEVEDGKRLEKSVRYCSKPGKGRVFFLTTDS